MYQIEHIEYTGTIDKIKRGHKIYLNDAWWRILLIREEINDYFLTVEAFGKGTINVRLDKNTIYTYKKT